jgi:hypothetical protein
LHFYCFRFDSYQAGTGELLPEEAPRTVHVVKSAGQIMPVAVVHVQEVGMQCHIIS